MLYTYIHLYYIYNNRVAPLNIPMPPHLNEASSLLDGSQIVDIIRGEKGGYVHGSLKNGTINITA